MPRTGRTADVLVQGDDLIRFGLQIHRVIGVDVAKPIIAIDIGSDFFVIDEKEPAAMRS